MVIYLIRGLPGSGKTTFAKSLMQNATVHHHLETDHILVEWNGGVYPKTFDLDKVKDAHSLCVERTKELLKKGESVAVSNTFVKLWETNHYIDLGYPVFETVLFGKYKNSHGVSNDKIATMKNKFEFRGGRAMENDYISPIDGSPIFYPIT